MTPKKLGRPQKTPDYLLRKHIQELAQNDFHYDVELDYHRAYDCENNHCDSICRCSTIEDARVVEGSFSWEDSITKLTNKQAPLMSYCIERLVRLVKFDVSDFEIEISGGYYGQEIDRVSLPKVEVQKLTQQLLALIELTDEQKIKFVLQAEYGHLLEKLDKPLTIELMELDRDGVKLPNQDYYRKVDSEKIELYGREYAGIRAVVYGKNYQLIDGYHRIVAAKKLGLDQVKVLALFGKEEK